MKKPLICLLFAATAIILNSCLLTRDPLPALWFYTFSGGATEERDSLLTPASFVEITADGSYTSDFGHFEYGTWSRKDQKLLFTNQQNTTSSFSLTGLTRKEMVLTTVKGIPLNFESQAISAKSVDDPFSLANNRWRIPAKHKENAAGIRKRLLDHCRFWEIYFTWALNDGIATVDVRSTATPIKIYGNGFGLKPYQDLPQEWKSCFFDEEDCRAANDIIEDIFQHKTIAWAHTDNKYKMFIGAFQQMEQYLR